MIKAGAFDKLESNRNTLLCSFENIIDTINNDNRRALSGQLNMFETNTDAVKDETLYKLIPQKELDKKYLLSMEKEVLGLYVSGHPLDNLVNDINKLSNIKSVDLLGIDNEDGNETDNFTNANILDGRNIRFIGIISEIKTKITKNNEIMAFITIEDLEGAINTIAFPKTYAGYKNVIFEDNIVKVEGRINVREDEVTVMISRIETYEARQTDVLMGFADKNKRMTLIISENLTEEQLTNLRNFVKLIGNQKTNTEVDIINKEIRKTLKLFINEKIYTKLKELAGEDNVKWE